MVEMMIVHAVIGICTAFVIGPNASNIFVNNQNHKIKINPLCSGSGSESESLSCDIFIGFDGESEVTLAEEDFELSCGHESALWVVKKPATIHFSSCYSEGNAVMEKLAFSVDGSDHNHHVTPVIVGASPFRQEAAWGLIFVATMMMIFLIPTHTFFGVVSVISIVDHFFGSENAIRTSVLHFIYWLFHAFVKPKGSIAIAAKNCIVDSRGPTPDGSAGGAAAPANKSCSSPSPIIPRSNSNGSTSPTPNANDLGARRASPENDTPTTVTPPSVASSRDTQAAPSTSSLSSEGVDNIHNTIETPSPVAPSRDTQTDNPTSSLSSEGVYKIHNTVTPTAATPSPVAPSRDTQTDNPTSSLSSEGVYKIHNTVTPTTVTRVECPSGTNSTIGTTSSPIIQNTVIAKELLHRKEEDKVHQSGLFKPEEIGLHGKSFLSHSSIAPSPKSEKQLNRTLFSDQQNGAKIMPMSFRAVMVATNDFMRDIFNRIIPVEKEEKTDPKIGNSASTTTFLGDTSSNIEDYHALSSSGLSVDDIKNGEETSSIFYANDAGVAVSILILGLHAFENLTDFVSSVVN